jgi:mono/diheme cytochrome c family protein
MAALARLAAVSVVIGVAALAIAAKVGQGQVPAPAPSATAKGPTLIDPEGLGLLIPPMNARRGRVLFAAEGCVVCHAVNGVGGGVASNLDAPEEGRLVNPYDFAARMWRGAAAMIALQNRNLGYQIDLDRREIADLSAFAHDRAEQRKFTEDEIPPAVRELLKLRNL